MRREELTNKVNELHRQVKQMDVGKFIIDQEEHEKQVEAMSISTLEDTIRFYEALLEKDE